MTASVNVAPTQPRDTKQRQLTAKGGRGHRERGLPPVADRVVAEDEDVGHDRDQAPQPYWTGRMIARTVISRIFTSKSRDQFSM